MKKFLGNEVIEVNSLYNVNTDMYEFDLFVEVVDKDEVSPLFDKFIGTVEYDNGDYLEVYYNGEKLIGYFENYDEI